MPQQTEDFIGTVDVRELHELDWPIVRLLVPSFVERLELRRYKQHLLTSGRWDRVRAVPRRDSSGGVSPHVFDLYGVSAPPTGAVTWADMSSVGSAAVGGSKRMPRPLAGTEPTHRGGRADR